MMLLPRFEFVFIIYPTVRPHDFVRNTEALVYLDLATHHL